MLSQQVKIIRFGGSNEEDTDTIQDLHQIRDLFVDGMRANEAPEDYILGSLQADLKDIESLRATYFEGRGVFLMLVEDEDEDSILSDSNGNREKNVDAGKRRKIKGMVGLQDVSSETGTERVRKKLTPSNNNPNSEQRSSKRSNLCELRRMSIHSSCRRLGYGTRVVEECISYAKLHKFDGIKLYTGGWMEPAIKFYTKMGFKDLGRLEYKNSDGSASIIAHLQLIF
mmetsp:Transcript_31208/g.47205  ORF Transcript_31208/g.47205 Transcript_31208/m.47205 type:complete len:227 (-) Transcript_31208:112-792(-)